MIEYKEGGISKFDIAAGPKQVDIFDDYWDKYRHDFVTMTQTEGRVNPKLWNDPKGKKKWVQIKQEIGQSFICLLYTSDAADE